jgi:hypothetical protein
MVKEEFCPENGDADWDDRTIRKYLPDPKRTGTQL